jgi:hypothetical protein
MPKRTFWLVTGVAIGAGSSVWAERRVRRTLHDAAARLQPDALVVTAARGARQAATATGRTARVGARTAGGRVRHAVAEGRDEMSRRQEELWAELSDRRAGAGASPGRR